MIHLYRYIVAVTVGNTPQIILEVLGRIKVRDRSGYIDPTYVGAVAVNYLLFSVDYSFAEIFVSKFPKLIVIFDLAKFHLWFSAAFGLLGF